MTAVAQRRLWEKQCRSGCGRLRKKIYTKCVFPKNGLQSQQQLWPVWLLWIHCLSARGRTDWWDCSVEHSKAVGLVMLVLFGVTNYPILNTPKTTKQHPRTKFETSDDNRHCETLLVFLFLQCIVYIYIIKDRDVFFCWFGFRLEFGIVFIVKSPT